MQVLGEPRAREVLPPQFTADYLRKLLDVFRVSNSLLPERQRSLCTKIACVMSDVLLYVDGRVGSCVWN